MSVVGVEDKKRVEEKITFWEDVYGILISFRFSLLLWSLRCLPYHIYQSLHFMYLPIYILHT